jgi:signal transduction histidine kinase
MSQRFYETVFENPCLCAAPDTSRHAPGLGRSSPDGAVEIALSAAIQTRGTSEDACRLAEETCRVATIAHDFRNNMQAIASALKIAERRIAGGRSDNVIPLIEAALASAARASALSKRLVDFSATGQSGVSRLQMNSTITAMGPAIGALLGTSIRLAFSLAEDLPMITCDVRGLENALLNLVVNARDAMPDGGTLVIETSPAYLSVDDPAQPAGRYIGLFVTDTGVGMSHDVVRRAFEPYFTTKGCGEGTGLGLPSTRAFATAYGGHVEAISAIGQGTSVRLFLPCC